MNLDRIKASSVYKFKSDIDLINAIEEISLKFTKERTNISDYVNNDRLVAAYTLFYLTTNYPKLEAAFTKIQKTFEDFSSYEIIDIGCGPGTFILSLLDHIEGVKVIGIEKSDLMRRQAVRILEDLHSGKDWKIMSERSPVVTKKLPRIGIFSHSANEMSSAEVQKYIETLDLDEVLFIEPGTKHFFEKIKEIRTSLVRKGWNISYPCPSALDCPMEGDDWCHQFIEVRHEVEIERLCQQVKKDRKLLPLTIHYYIKEEVQREKIKIITRVFKPNKSAHRWDTCYMKDGELKHDEVEQLKRGKSKEEFKRLEKLMSGDEISFETIKVLTDKLRVNIKSS